MNAMTTLTQSEINDLFREVEEMREEDLAKLSMSVKVICVTPDRPHIAMVKNREKQISETVIKKSGWELPGGGVKLENLRETPQDAAIREFNQETGIPFSHFEILEVLGGFRKRNIKVSGSGRYHYNIVFLATIKEMAKETSGGLVKGDPTEGTLQWTWIDPFTDIQREGKWYSFKGELVHGSSMEMINRLLFQNGD